MIPISKVCGHCKIEKIAEFFPLRKKNGGKYVWLRLQCFECVNEISREKYIVRSDVLKKAAKNYYLKNKEDQNKKKKLWRELNKEKIKQKRKVDYKLKSEVIKAKRKEYYKSNKEKHKNSVKEYSKNNKDKINHRLKIRHQVKKVEDLNYKVIRILRGRVLKAIKNKGVKCARTIQLTGCKMDFLINHIESLFKDSMSWDNHGLKGWHLDHKIPISSFDLSDATQQQICFNWRNLQPLWAKDNLSKSDKIEECYGNI